jgi:photosystem II stability/assembly factor-like uncharacterized protein
MTVRTLVLTALLAAAMLPAPAGDRASAPARDGARGPEDEAREITEPGDWMFAQRARDGVVAPDGYRRALADARETRARSTSDPLSRATWTSLGPTDVGGRVVDLAIDPSDAGVVYAATASGGVWKSTDGALTFTPSWPDDAVQAMGAIAVAPDGTLFAGTGEANPGGGSSTFTGDGVYRSRDGGASWHKVGLAGTGAIGRIAVEPSDPSRVYVAAAGNLFVPGGERGLYRSLDGGDSWHLVLGGANDRTGAIDVAVDPLHPERVYAAMWDHVRTSSRRTYGGPGSGLHRSTDAGSTWTRIDLDDDATGRIGVAVAGDRAYATAVDAQGRPVGVFRSDDGGATWQRTGPLLGQATYGWWFGRVWIDPADADHVFVAGVNLYQSTDGGRSFLSELGAVHADQHAMSWRGRRVYLGNDGGVYRSELNGSIGSFTGAVSQGWTQHYSVGVGQHLSNVVVSGFQDNYCQRTLAAGASTRGWSRYGQCGDGLQTLVHPLLDSILYGCAQYGLNCSVSFDAGTSFVPMTRPLDERFNWWMPLTVDPINPALVFAAGERVDVSADAGVTWRAISPDLTTNPQQDDPEYPFGTITTIAVSGDSIYAGTDDGLLWHSPDHGATWDRSTDPDIPGSWVTRVTADGPGTAYASFSGYRDGDVAAYVLRTADAGRTWDDISGDLPGAPVNEVIVADGVLVAATDVGVFASRDGGSSWITVGTGLPLVPVIDLSYSAGMLTAATYGRGVMRTQLA